MTKRAVPAAGAAEAATWATDVERRLRAHANRERATKEKAYLKSERTHLGVPVPTIRKLTRGWAKDKGLDRDGLLALVPQLWDSDVHELMTAAADLLDHRSKWLGPEDIPLLERLLRTSKTWALVDGLAVHVVGAIVSREPTTAQVLDRWATDGDFWIRRSAMLALLDPLRRGSGDLPRFLRYADTMLEEREFFIRKAIGWILREASRKRPDEVARWLAPRTHRASGVTMREAVKHLPEPTRQRLMDAYRAKRPATTTKEAAR